MRSNARHNARPGRSLALAIALMCGTAIGATAFEAPAYAQKKDKKKKADKPDYSKDFIEAYQAADELVKAETPDYAAIKVKLDEATALAKTPDDNFVLGNMTYIVGRNSQDIGLQRAGVGRMLDSGKTPEANLGQYSFLAGQLAYQEQDWAEARKRVQEAIAAGYTDNDPQAIVAETYFNEGSNAEGLAYLKGIIDARAGAGLAVDESWLRRGITVAYQNDLAEQAIGFAGMYASMYPSTDSWGDAIAIQRNFYDYDQQATLDILRLARRAEALRTERDYVDYIDAADFRRLPGEVKAVADAGLAKGLLQSSDVFVNEARSGANSRIQADQAELPSLERDARNGSSLPTVMAAGDAFLSYGQAAKAEEFYAKALTLPGVDTPRIMTRLGIAQLDQGKTAEAAATFEKVQGARQAIARLWALYAGQQGAPAAAAAPAAEEATGG
ncbi:hypothetical protein [Parerythrobacter jejuensis]|uniref:Tetratricopeptide repeat protein n=1 Tax=Parerythrobacter jejuensis TaxID=795812 RepID=A0A845AQ24_9SPHN|nr:hypothetical protein [Parerythrobacter jejuensis]MXP32400.1 hypothetical protein [Parerythrobacter jejuensis]